MKVMRIDGAHRVPTVKSFSIKETKIGSKSNTKNIYIKIKITNQNICFYYTLFKGSSYNCFLTFDISEIHEPFDEHQYHHVEEQEDEENHLRYKFGDDAQFIFKIPKNMLNCKSLLL